MSRAVLCEVQTNDTSTPAGQIFFHLYFASTVIVYIEMGFLKNCAFGGKRAMSHLQHVTLELKQLILQKK
jgi:hypothetical protein